MNTPVNAPESTTLGKIVTQAAVLLNIEKDFFHGKGLKRVY